MLLYSEFWQQCIENLYAVFDAVLGKGLIYLREIDGAL
ncbi:MAG: hypothetical protein BWY95_01418 [Bacteroidetes bacterium ADurb.BinA104]|nr:MAG: hypothetical protein BWY95_01418 [Bacteroidetes bacterium ADurb.BinA104]